MPFAAVEFAPVTPVGPCPQRLAHRLLIPRVTRHRLLRHRGTPVTGGRPPTLLTGYHDDHEAPARGQRWRELRRPIGTDIDGPDRLVDAGEELRRFRPYPDYKDSGVEWLGDIPAHWILMPLKHILSRCDYGISESLGGSGDIRVLTMAQVQHGDIVLPDDGSIDAVDWTLVLESGDLLFNRTNSRDLVGRVGIFRGRRQDQVTLASYLVRLTARDNVEPERLNYLLNSTGLLGMARSMALLSVNEATLNPTKYQQVVVPIPGLSEQQTIGGFARCETTRIGALIAKVRKAIDQLKEFRTALISAAVAGKIDVRATSDEASAGHGGTR